MTFLLSIDCSINSETEHKKQARFVPLVLLVFRSVSVLQLGNHRVRLLELQAAGGRRAGRTTCRSPAVVGFQVLTNPPCSSPA